MLPFLNQELLNFLAVVLFIPTGIFGLGIGRLTTRVAFPGVDAMPFAGLGSRFLPVMTS